MAYCDFTPPGLKILFGLQTQAHKDLFIHPPSVVVSSSLTDTLEYQLPVALEIGAE